MGTVRPQGGFRAEVTVKSSEPPPKPLDAKAKLGLLGRGVVSAVHSRFAVWIVIVTLLSVVAIATVGFERLGWAPKFIPLYAADAEMLLVASALYVIAVRWGHGPERG